MSQYQYTILGGGLVGATTALALAKFHLPICVLETKPRLYEQSADLLEMNTIALSYASAQLYQYLGLWSEIMPYAEPINEVHVSTRGHWGGARLSKQQVAYPALGYVIATETLKNVLYETLDKIPNVELRFSASLAAVRFEAGQWYCEQDDKKNFKTQLLLLAEGASSTVRDMLGIGTYRYDYKHHVIMANVKLSQSLSGCAVERFIDAGVIALLPWKNNIATMVLSFPREKSELFRSYADAEIMNICQQALGQSYGVIEAIGKKIVVPLNMQLSQQHFFKQLLLLGNSVHSIHPIAAQGFNLSLRDIKRLYVSIAKSVDPAKWGSSLFELSDYVRTCQSDQQKIIAATDKLAHSLEKVPGFLKAVSINSLDTLMPMKALFTRLAMGLDF
ncbi:FAD-dependent monooxygenase [Candidatus Berkiella cookevillensis]|uniref:2-octaprenyl-6-methoxyphenol hydroxylase n=1 Tax=Candidatus Berkiella cookevillensis TaxID=437022 RepID=A0A0Q9YMS0_9GAMM|nr:FAD-dependent monooxygenase [Candidatus Berkiella cookevillensis]MCS5709561.1 FAD-dependent monooxygenase [Candidatus Berkiella cookevillensis]